MAPQQMKDAVDKVTATGNKNVPLTERGTCFGYGQLVNDMPGIAVMQQFAPVIFDVTHSTQRPGAAGGASGGNRAAVPLGNSTANGQSHAGSLVHFAGMEALEDVEDSLPILLIESDAVVPHRNLTLFAAGPPAGPTLSTLPHKPPLDLDHRGLVHSAKFQGVADKILEELAHLQGIGLDCRQVIFF